MFDRGGGGVVRMEGKLWRIVTLVELVAAALVRHRQALPASLCNTQHYKFCDKV